MINKFFFVNNFFYTDCVFFCCKYIHSVFTECMEHEINIDDVLDAIPCEHCDSVIRELHLSEDGSSFCSQECEEEMLEHDREEMEHRRIESLHCKFI